MKKQSNYYYTEEQFAEQLKTHPHLVEDSLAIINANHASEVDNTQSALLLELRSQDRYSDVSKTKMLKLIASMVKHNQLAGWVSQRKHGFVMADQVKTKKSKPKAKKNKAARLPTKKQIEREEREAALKRFRQKVRAKLNKEFGLD